MANPVEHLRRLSKTHRKRIDKARGIAERMTRTAEAAKRAGYPGENEKE